jgi:hypothetical protein
LAAGIAGLAVGVGLTGARVDTTAGVGVGSAEEGGRLVVDVLAGRGGRLVEAVSEEVDAEGGTTGAVTARPGFAMGTVLSRPLAGVGRKALREGTRAARAGRSGAEVGGSGPEVGGEGGKGTWIGSMMAGEVRCATSSTGALVTGDDGDGLVDGGADVGAKMSLASTGIALTLILR